MNFFSRAASVAVVVFRGLWVVLSAVLWTVGLIGFLDDKRFVVWLGWGFLCAIPLCVQILKTSIENAREGAEEGSHEYTITITDSEIRAHDHSVSGAVFGFIGGLIGGVLIGPVVLPIFVVGVIGAFVSDIANLVKK